MSQTKAQLIQPIGVVTASGVVVSGVMTAATFDGDVVGSATSIIQGTNLNVGAFNATSFAGDFTGNATGIITSSAIKVGQLTASSFVGDFTGTATSMMRGTGFEAGAVTGTSFVADVTGNVTGNATGLAGSVTQGTNIHVGIVTVTGMSGDGSNLTGIAATNYNTQTVTANGAATTIDLSAGNVITFNQSANTTVSLANTSESMSVTLIRIKDTNSTTRTVTWPDSIQWNGGSAPDLVQSNISGDEYDQIQLLTRDEGVTWYGWFPASNSRTDTSVWMWGLNNTGQLGQNQPGPSYRSSPVQVGTDTDWNKDKISRGRYFATAFKTDGTAWVWGTTENGVLGQNSGPGAGGFGISSPVQLPGSWSNLPAGYTATFGVKTDGTAWAWGINENGVLGLNQNHDVRLSSPTQLGTDTTWDTVSTGSFYTAYGVKTDGTFWGWGDPTLGALGLNDNVLRSSPTQLPGSTWSTNIAGLSYTVATTKTDGTLWAWGYNAGGQLGQNNTTAYSSPKQIPGTTWSQVEGIANNAFIATKTNGTLWVWGSNSYGQLGQNSTTPYSSPRQVGTSTDWVECAAMTKAAAGRKTDGTLWVWGSADNGFLGLNAKNPDGMRSSPTQLPGTLWAKVVGSRTYGGFMATQSG